ncbi:MAG: glycosyltransferase family 39 protein [Candidatus Harrisonbacteria bacterium]|nr:glycosyltransferase family 39 protein [Candidatus Harrisonbacteria bacterium]
MNRRYIFAATFIFGFTAALIIYFFAWNNYFWFDEGIFVQLVRNIAERGVWGITIAPDAFFSASLITIGYPIIYPAVAAVRLFGASIATFHVVASLFTLGLVMMFFLLSRALYGARMAAWGTLALATFTPLYGNGKSFAGEAPALFFLMGALLLLAYAERLERPGALLLLATGIAFGFAASAKPTFLVALPALLAALLWKYRYMVLTQDGRRATAVVALGVCGALAFWLWTQFGGASLARIFAHYANPYYIADFWPLISANLKRFFTESTPAHLAVLFFASVAFLGWKIRRREPVRMAEIAAFVFALLTLAFYVRTEGWYRYFFPAHVTLFLFLAPAAREFVGIFISRAEWQKRLFVVLISAAVAIQIPPLITEARRVRSDLPDTIGAELQALRDNRKVFFYNLPQIAARYPSGAFYQYIRMSDNLIVGQENEQLLAQGEFSVTLVPRISGPEIARIPSCYMAQDNVGKIFMYRRRLNVPCE